MIDLQQINIWGTIAAALAVFALGGLWFSPVLFGKAWGTSIRKEPRQIGTPAVALTLSLITALIQAFILAVLFQIAGLDTAELGLTGGLCIAVLIFTLTLSDAAFVGDIKSRWWWIQAVFRILAMLLMAAIIGASAPESPVRKLKHQLENAGETIQKSIRELGKSLK
jgi:Protein of unknown function (DUF1761)